MEASAMFECKPGCFITSRESGARDETHFAVHSIETDKDGGVSLLLPFIDAETNKQDRVYLNAATVRAILEARGTAGVNLNP
jgi:hypothetical protein